MTRLNADVLATRVADGIAVITLGNAKRIYSDQEMGDALTEALDGFAGDASVRVVVVTGGAPGYFIRHFTVAAYLSISQSHCALRIASGPRTRLTTEDSSTRRWRCAKACQSQASPLFPAHAWQVDSSSRSPAIFVSLTLVTS